VGGKSAFELSKIFDLAQLDRFCQSHNVVFVVKKHFFHRNEKEDLTQFTHLVDITNTEYDTQLLLKKAAILVTDYSSCYVDYLLLNKPIIFYNYDYDDYVLNDRDLYFDYEGTTPGPKVKDFSSLLGSLETSMNESEETYRIERERVKNMFYAKDNQGIVGEKILSYVKQSL
jgi:CDP-glycerol glycerophosphotransferase (TagB/SpsB family)